MDWTKVSLNTALASDERPIHIRVRHVDGTEGFVDPKPVKPEGASKAFLEIGVYPSYSLHGVKPTDWPADPENPDLESEGFRTLRPGDVITHINGVAARPQASLFTPGDPGDYYKLIDAVQKSKGKPIELTIKRSDGKVETVSVQPHFQLPFGETPFNIAGMQPRMRVSLLSSTKSPVLGKMKPRDITKSIEVRNANRPASQPGDMAPDVSVTGFIKTVSEAGEKDQTLDFVVLRDGKPVLVDGIKASIKVGLKTAITTIAKA